MMRSHLVRLLPLATASAAQALPKFKKRLKRSEPAYNLSVKLADPEA